MAPKSLSFILMPTTIPEQDAIRALRVARATEEPELIEKAKLIVDGYSRQQEATGRPLWENTRLAAVEKDREFRSRFQDRETHGLPPAKADELRTRYANDPDGRAAIFNADFLARKFKTDGQTALKRRSELMAAYSMHEWGEVVDTDAAFFEGVAGQMDLEDSIAERAQANALLGAGYSARLDEGLARLDDEEGFNPAFQRRRDQWRKTFEETARATDERLKPYRHTINATVNELRSKMGVDDEAGDDPRAWREIAEELVKVPARDRGLVLAAIGAQGGEDESKDWMQKLGENVGRGLEDIYVGLPNLTERQSIMQMKRLYGAADVDPSTLGFFARGEMRTEASMAKAQIDLLEANNATGAFVDAVKSRGVVQTDSDDFREVYLAVLDYHLETLDLSHQIRQIAEEEIDPAKGEWLVTNGLYMAARSAPYTLASLAGPIGFAVVGGALGEMSYHELRARNPDMTAEQAQGLAMVGAPMQAAVERLSGKLLTGNLKSLNRFYNQISATPGAAMKRFGTRVAGTAGLEMVHENVQDATPFVLQSVFGALQEDLPDTPWEAILGDVATWEHQAELFFAILPLAIIGAGAGTVRDVRGGRALLSGYNEMRALGVGEAAASEIVGLNRTGDVEGAQARLREAFADIGADQKGVNEARAEAIPKLHAERAELSRLHAEGVELGILPTVRRTQDGYRLAYADGSTSRVYDTFAEANERTWQAATERGLAVHDDTRHAIDTALRGIESGQELRVRFSAEAPSLRAAVDRGWAPEASAEERVSIEEEINRDIATAETQVGLVAANAEDRLAGMQILGRSESGMVEGGIWQTTITLFRNANPLTVIEEKAEGDAKYMLTQLGLRKWMLGALREAEAITGEKFLEGVSDAEATNQRLVEAWSHLAVSYFLGADQRAGAGVMRQIAGLRKDAQRALATDSAVAASLTAYSAILNRALTRAAMLQDAKADGALDADLEDMLARSLGMDSGLSEQRARVEEAAKIAEEVGASFSVGPRVESVSDAEYLAAVERGDMAEAQRMVDAAADDAGFVRVDSTDSVDPEFIEPMNGVFQGRESQVEEMARQFIESGYEGRPLLVIGSNAITGSHRIHAARRANEIIDDEGIDVDAIEVPIYELEENQAREFDEWLQEEGTWTQEYAEFHRQTGDDETRAAIAAEALEAGAVPLEFEALLRAESQSNDEDYTPRGFAGFKGDIYASTSAIKSADPVTYDESGNIIPLSQRFDPTRDEITFSIAPAEVGDRMARMFSPFQRTPEARAKLGLEMARRTQAVLVKFLPIIAAHRTKKDIEGERRQREGEILDAKLATLSGAEVAALEAGASLDDAASRPILSELLTRRTYQRADGKTGWYWGGSLMSKTAAERAGIDTSRGGWDDIPSGLPPYVWGGTLHPDQAASAAGFETVSDFWQALQSEIDSFRRVSKQAEAAASRTAELQREARAESLEWAEAQQRARETVGTDKALLLGALRTLDAILSALPIEVRGKVGGYVKLAQLSTPRAMLEEIERRVESIDRHLENHLRAEAQKRMEKLFKRAKPTRSEAGKAPKGKAGADLHALFDRLKEAMEWDGDQAETHAAGLEERINKGEMTADQEAHAAIEANLVRLFSGWGDAREDSGRVDSRGRPITVVVRPGADAARRHAALDAAEHVWKEGYLAEQKRRAEERERRAEIRASLIEDAGTGGTRRERMAKAIRDNGLKGKWKDSILNLLNFQQVAGFVFGENSLWARHFADQERNADFAKMDSLFALYDRIDDLFRDLAGSAVEGAKLRWRLAQPTIETTQAGAMSEMSIIQALLMWRQEDGRRHMQGKRDDEGNVVSSWAYDQGFIDEIESKLSDEGFAVMQFLMDDYAGEWERINPVFRDLNGIDLPRNSKYSPLTVQPTQAPGGQTMDPMTGSTMSNGSITPGSLRTRAQVVAEPDFKDALEVFIAHRKQIEHWIAYAPFLRDAQAVLGNRDLGNVVRAKSGDEAVKTLRSWLDLFAQGGARDAASHLAVTGMLRNMVGRAAMMALVGRVGTLAIQSTQLGAALAKMPTGAYVVRMGKLLTGNLSWRASFASPYVQRRIKQMPVVVQAAMDGLRSAEPNRIQHAARELGKLLSGADALFTAGTYAIIYDYQLKQAREMGLEGAEAEAHARRVAERDTEEVAQPTRAGARAIFESVNTNPLAKAGWAFASEGRKNLGLVAYTFASRSAAERARALVYVIGINGIMASVIRSTWQDIRDSDDEEIFDERIWNVKRMTLATLTEPIYGFPVVGELATQAIFGIAGEYRPTGTLLDAPMRAPSAIRRIPDTLAGETEWEDAIKDAEALLMLMGFGNDTIAGAASISHLARDAFSIGKNLVRNLE